MKKYTSKKFVFLLIMIFSLGLLPTNSLQAITQNHIDSEVQIVCPDNYGNWFSGSGTIIDQKGIILTNKHVVTDEHGGIIKTCFIGFTESIDQEPNFGPKNNPNLATVKYYTTKGDMDAAILYLDNAVNKSYKYVDVWNSNSSALRFGNKIEAIGFPGIGGSTITYTSGDFSGFGSTSDGTQNYIKATTPLEHGNSGGAAYNQEGQFIGVPTMVVAGTLNSLSYILSINSIKNWLSGVFGKNYQQEIIEEKPIVEKPKMSIQDDITPPQMKDYNIEYKIINDDNSKKSYIQYSIPSSSVGESGSLDKIYYYFGSNKLADPLLVGKSFKPSQAQNIEIPEKFLLSLSELYFIIRLQDNSGNISSSIVAPWDVSAILKTGAEAFIYNQALINFKGTDDKVLQKFSGLFVKNNEAIWWVSPKDKVRFLLYHPSLDTSFTVQMLNSWYTSWWNGYYASTGITTSNLVKKPKHIWGHLLSEQKDDGTGAADTEFTYHYIHPRTGKLYSLDKYISWPYVDITTSDGLELLKFIKSISVDILTVDLNRIEPLGSKNYIWQTLEYGRSKSQLPLYGFNVPVAQNQQTADAIGSSQVVSRVRGYILLQIESHGEGWYVNPQDSKRYFLGRPTDAFQIMRKIGLGVTHEFIAKYQRSSFPDNVVGKILIDVEDSGKAYYIYPKNRHAYYLGLPTDAFKVMRELGLGISNSDLEKIGVQ